MMVLPEVIKYFLIKLSNFKNINDHEKIAVVFFY